MNITPLDIRKHEFRRAMRGYDVDEVHAFLDMVSVECEKLINQNAIFQDKVQQFELQLKKYHDIEGTLQETLLSAERAREETVKTAKKQAEVIVREAEVKAASIIEEGRKTFSELRGAINTLKVQKESYVAKLTALVNAQLEMFAKTSFDQEENIERAEDVFLKTSGAGDEHSHIPAPAPEPIPEDEAFDSEKIQLRKELPDEDLWQTFD